MVNLLSLRRPTMQVASNCGVNIGVEKLQGRHLDQEGAEGSLVLHQLLFCQTFKVFINRILLRLCDF